MWGKFRFRVKSWLPRVEKIGQDPGGAGPRRLAPSLLMPSQGRRAQQLAGGGRGRWPLGGELPESSALKYLTRGNLPRLMDETRGGTPFSGGFLKSSSGPSKMQDFRGCRGHISGCGGLCALRPKTHTRNHVYFKVCPRSRRCAHSETLRTLGLGFALCLAGSLHHAL